MKALGLAAIVTAAATLGVSARQTPIYKAGDPGVTQPVVVVEQKTAYTAEAMRAKIAGSVEMEAVIGVDGKAANIKVVRSLDPGLDKNAIAALGEWRFEPATKSGTPVPVLVTIEMTFTLRDPRVYDESHTQVKAPVIVKEQKPSYTPEAMQNRIEGSVEVEGTVGFDGAVTALRVVKSLFPVLDAQAIVAMRDSTFWPALLVGRAVRYRVKMLFTFTLRD
jgi:TonB family protein